jgi:hypothetical protein
MNVALPLGKMTVAEKLQAMEELWADLSRDEQLESPAWHETILRERANQTDFVDWETAKKQLRDRLE